MGKILSYKQNFFVLREGRRETRLSLKEAVRVKEFADKRAVKILDRALVKKYAFSDPLSLSLDPHQVDGVRWILTRSRSYLAHAPGAGKTRQAIEAAARAEGIGQVVFVVPPTATVNWEREIMKWGEVWGGWPSISIIPETDKADTVQWNADILIVPHSMLTRDWVLTKLVALKKKFIAVDEASAFKEPDSQRTIALFGGFLKCGCRSPGLIRGSRHAVLMDGSPSPNGRPIELWAPTYAMAPETIDFMSREEFGFRYCGATQNERGNWEFKHASNVEELHAKLKKDFMHVVTEEQLNHPERLRKIVWVSDEIKVPEGAIWNQSTFSRLNYRISEEGEKASQGELAEIRAELGMRKIPWIANYVGERLREKNESILLFAWHRDVVLGLAKRLARFNPGVVMGGTPEGDREKYFKEFQGNARKLLILNIASGGRIHNLTRADRVVFGEFSWSDETNKQAEKRASRKGNERAFTPCDYVACPQSIDEPVLKALFRKIKNTKRLIG